MEQIEEIEGEEGLYIFKKAKIYAKIEYYSNFFVVTKNGKNEIIMEGEKNEKENRRKKH